MLHGAAELIATGCRYGSCGNVMLPQRSHSTSTMHNVRVGQNWWSVHSVQFSQSGHLPWLSNLLLWRPLLFYCCQAKAGVCFKVSNQHMKACLMVSCLWPSGRTWCSWAFGWHPYIDKLCSPCQRLLNKNDPKRQHSQGFIGCRHSGMVCGSHT